MAAAIKLIDVAREREISEFVFLQHLGKLGFTFRIGILGLLQLVMGVKNVVYDCLMLSSSVR